MPTTITAIIVNWQLKEETLRCIQSLEHQSISCHILVVDNGSHDGSIDYIRQHAPTITIVELPTNLGFGVACNRAIDIAMLDPHCEFVVLINNDVTLASDTIRMMLTAAQTNPGAGIYSPKIYWRDQPQTIWYAGARQRRYVFAAADTGQGQLDHGQFDSRHSVDYIFGTVMFIRCSLIEQIGGFDERFFLYIEDLDFCLRARQVGADLMFVPHAHAWHSGSASTATNRSFRTYHQARSTMLFLRKYTAFPQLLPVLCFWVLVGLRKLIVDFLRGKRHEVYALLAGTAEGIREAVL